MSILALNVLVSILTFEEYSLLSECSKFQMKSINATRNAIGSTTLSIIISNGSVLTVNQKRPLLANTYRLHLALFGSADQSSYCNNLHYVRIFSNQRWYILTRLKAILLLWIAYLIWNIRLLFGNYVLKTSSFETESRRRWKRNFLFLISSSLLATSVAYPANFLRSRECRREFQGTVAVGERILGGWNAPFDLPDPRRTVRSGNNPLGQPARRRETLKPAPPWILSDRAGLSLRPSRPS